MSKNTQRLTFTLYVEGQQPRAVYPRYNQDIRLEYTRESGEQFARRTLSGKLTFVGEDVDYILSQPFDARYNIAVGNSEDYTIYFRGYFTRVDCTVDVDGHMIETALTAADGYTHILAGMTTEVDLATLPLPVVDVQCPRTATYQMYIYGDDRVTNYNAGMFFEREAEGAEKLNRADLEKRGFELTSVPMIVTITRADGFPELLGKYSGFTVMQTDGVSKCTLDKIEGAPTSCTVYVEQKDGLWYMRIDRGGAKLFESANIASQGLFPTQGQCWADEYISEDAPLRFTAERDFVFTRLLTDAATVDLGGGSVSTSALPADDFAPLGYGRAAAQHGYMNYIYMSTQTVPEATQWGIAPNGGYFVPPLYPSTLDFRPISPLFWGTFSMWMLRPPFDDAGVTTVRLRDGYLLSDVIAAILSRVAPEITHAATVEYSRFLYGSMSPVADVALTLVLFQKSNVLNLLHTEPARVVPITLESVFNMLAAVLKCYWFVDDDNRLRIEHLSYFEHGGSYDDVPAVGVDLTRLYNTRNGKALTYGQRKYKYEKGDIPQQYVFEWGDDVSAVFKGEPIEVLSNNVSRGNIETVSAGDYNTDIASMLMMPDEMSKDGFALMGCVATDAVLATSDVKVPHTEDITALAPLLMQNYITLKTNQFITIRGNIVARVPSSGVPIGEVRFVLLDVHEPHDPVVYSIPITLRYNGTPTPFAVSLPAAPDAALLQLSAEGTRESSVDMTLTIDSIESLAVPTVEINQAHYTNGYLSYTWLQPHVWLYGMAARTLRVNGEEMQAVTVSRNKRQDVTFPASNLLINIDNLVNAGFGGGFVESYTLSLLSQTASMTLSYETDK